MRFFFFSKSIVSSATPCPPTPRTAWCMCCERARSFVHASAAPLLLLTSTNVLDLLVQTYKYRSLVHQSAAHPRHKACFSLVSAKACFSLVSAIAAHPRHKARFSLVSAKACFSLVSAIAAHPRAHTLLISRPIPHY
jgi:hypothetical protein